MPVVIGALSLVQKDLGKYVEKPLRHQYRGTPKDQPSGHSPFTKSVLSIPILNNGSPSHSQGNWSLLGALDSTKSERKNT